MLSLAFNMVDHSRTDGFTSNFIIDSSNMRQCLFTQSYVYQITSMPNLQLTTICWVLLIPATSTAYQWLGV
ncbi:hypothetical protein SERLA73DRAFT_172488 [Serpula lacrymans var. lacrymans S7.3]|uniref:Uncharacterized protein n=1 Tax=Serpula lacrymans var. lacrymans (strain S7.3) TaxID=936435 RepID=F8QFJ3_SERL3|nr:hypothetical protein SERLA73DRAFT_172488 [Serpula lacrymans var. lacrymans S7.3]